MVYKVEADYKSVAFSPDLMEQRRMQSGTLSAVFETYFRVLKHTVQPVAPRFARVRSIMILLIEFFYTLYTYGLLKHTHCGMQTGIQSIA